MLTQVLKAKIHRATVTQAELDYVGSITIDEALIEAAGIREYERVQVVDINNGNRLETYVIAGERDSGIICLNGAAARLVEIGDKVIIMAYVWLNEQELEGHHPTLVFVDHVNRSAHIANYEKHGLLIDQDDLNTEWQ